MRYLHFYQCFSGMNIGIIYIDSLIDNLLNVV